MNYKISGISKMLFLSITFSMVLLVVRFAYSHTFDYRFYGWNTFLAAIPYVTSIALLKLKKINIAAVSLLLIWLLFFPNAPYLITDILHYEERPPVPFWYDILLVISATWNGVMLGFVSLMNIERFLSKFLKPIWVSIFEFLSLFICSYGVFIGRFLRFNSWDIVTDPAYLAYTSAHHILLPQRYPKLWVFTILLSVLLFLFYFTLKKLPKLVERNSE